MMASDIRDMVKMTAAGVAIAVAVNANIAPPYAILILLSGVGLALWATFSR